MSLPINKDLLELRHAHSLHIIYGFCAPSAEVSRCNRDHYGPENLKYFLSGYLQEKFADCGLKQCTVIRRWETV